MYEKLEECPLCQFSSHSNHLIIDDHSHSKESFALVKCDKCALIYTHPRPDKDSIASYYEHDNYISHTNKSNNITNTLYKVARTFTLKWKKGLINQYSNGKTLLDYGCGTGDLLAHLQRSGWDVSGIEPNDQARAKAEEKDLSVFPEFSKGLKESYDIITAWHVIEHVHDLKDTVRQLRKMLHKSGKLLIAVPNCASFDATHYGSFWAGYDVPRHLYHFTPDTMKILAAKTKFKVEKIIPMKLDAFYVSILSEKYHQNNLHLLRGLKVGMRSNKMARTNGNYSSLIYVLAK